MKLLLPLIAVLLLNSCSVLRKHKSSEQKAVDSVSISVKDTLSAVHKDSVFTKTQTSENVNETVIEFDNDTSAAIKSDTARRIKIPINSSDYFYIPNQKIKKITIRTSQSANNVEGGKLSTQTIQAGHKDDLTKNDKTEIVNKESKSRCSFPLWEIIVLLLIAGVLYWAWQRYKSFPIIHL